MAKGKKSSGKARRGRPTHPSRKAWATMEAALDIAEAGEPLEALPILVQLADVYPRSRDVLQAVLAVCFQVEHWPLVTRFSEQLLPLQEAEEQARTLNNLVLAYSRLDFPVLAWKASREFITRFPDHANVPKFRAIVQETEAFLEDGADHLMPERSLSPEEELEVLVQYDRLRLYLTTGQIQESLEIGETLLQKLPHAAPILNNLSQAQFLAGKREQAIATAARVLEGAPDNFNALSNLGRFYFLAGQFEAARELADRLREVRSDSPDLEPKQAELLAFLGDDEGVCEAYERARRRKIELPPLLLHLAATAHFRLGDEKRAWSLWRKAVKIDPSFDLAQECLADRFARPGEGDVPWYWPLGYWFPIRFREELGQAVGQPTGGKREGVVRRKTRTLLKRYPFLPKLLPHILEKGDFYARSFAIAFLRVLDREDLFEILRDFALGPYGNDEMRMEIIEFLLDEHPHLLPEDRLVTMWVRGEHRAVVLQAYEIFTEPELDPTVPDEIQDKLEDVYWLLHERKTEEAERLLKEVLAEKSDFPVPHNQLAVVYEMQGRREEARALLEEIHARFPDYFFARASLARLYAREDQVLQAKELVAPLIRQKRLHVSEFRSLAQAQLEIFLAEGNVRAAQSWLDMWSELDDEHPDIPYWQKRLDNGGLLGSVTRRMGRRRPGQRR